MNSCIGNQRTILGTPISEELARKIERENELYELFETICEEILLAYDNGETTKETAIYTLLNYTNFGLKIDGISGQKLLGAYVQRIDRMVPKVARGNGHNNPVFEVKMLRGLINLIKNKKDGYRVSTASINKNPERSAFSKAEQVLEKYGISINASRIKSIYFSESSGKSKNL